MPDEFDESLRPLRLVCPHQALALSVGRDRSSPELLRERPAGD
jgi:hypothetical protein